MDRRDFLKLSALTGVAVVAPVTRAGATEERFEGPFFVVVNASGGWDTTYLMDPKGTPQLNRLYDAGEILSAGAIDYAPTEGRTLGPGLTNREFFERYASELVVVNGIDISVNNHTPCSRYVATGKLDSLQYPTFPALVAAARCPEAPLAFMTFGQYSATGNVVASNRVPYMSRLRDLATVDHANASRPFYHDGVLAEIEATLREVEADGHSLPRVDRARSFVFAAQTSSKALQRVVPFIPSTMPTGRLEQQAEIALAAFASGLAVSANLSIGQFDSHDDNDAEQMTLIPELLSGVDYLLRRAEDLGIRDQLVVILQSEMGRTPWYNGDAGKDHWSVGSMMALSSRIAGNRVVGRTGIDPGTGHAQAAATIDPTTLDDDPGGIRIRPEHVQLAQRQLAGIDTHPLAVRFPLDVPSEERLVGLFG